MSDWQEHAVATYLQPTWHISEEKCKVSFFVQWIKKQLITLQNFNIQTCFSQFLWFFSLRFWFKGQIIFRIHVIMPNAYKPMCFDRNIIGNKDAKFLDCDYLLVQRSVKLTLGCYIIDWPQGMHENKNTPYSFKK